jgi:hypothetical protein
MRLPRITRKKLLIFIIILVIGIPVLAFGMLLIALSFINVKLIGGPDCNGLPIKIQGFVQDVDAQPVANAKIRACTTGLYDDLDLEFTSDNKGYFSYTGTRSIFLFACDDLGFEVSASGFKEKHITYSLFDNYTEDQLSTINPNLIDIEITLERSA